MSIASEKIKAQTLRFLLVRVNPGRYIAPTLDAGLYKQTLDVKINRIERNGVALTKDSSSPSVNDHWYQNEQTGALEVKLASAPNDTTNVLIAYYYLFYTGTTYRSISENPEDDATTIREWLPLIQNYSSILQSFNGIINGVFSINDTTIEIINADKSFQRYLGDNDSFYNKTVDIWLCIEDETNIQKIFTGTIKNIQVSKNLVTLNCVDSFNKLKASATFGDDTDEVYYRTSGFAALDAKFGDFAIPYIVGKTSRYTTYTEAELATGIFSYRIDDGNKAACVSFELPAAVTVNRTWGACRQKTQVQTQSFGAVQAVLEIASGYFFIRFASLSNVQLGDTIKFDTTEYGLVTYLGSFTHSSVNYNCIINADPGAFTLSSVVSPLKSFGVVIRDNTTQELIYPLYGRDYTIDDSTVTSGGNRFVQIVFISNFEANLSVGALDPTKNEVVYRTSLVAETHADFLKSVMDRVGIPTNNASFTQAETDLNVNCRFSVPNFDEQDYDTYLKYCQDVLASTLGFLKVNSSFEVEYKLLSAPSSTDIRDSSLMLVDESNIQIEYQDIQTKIIAYNPHNSSTFEGSFTPSPSETLESTKSRWLSGIENVTRFRHSLETITNRIQQHIGLKSQRFVKYIFKTATEDIDSELGTDLEIQSDMVLGGGGISDVKVITIEKSPKFIAIEASDLKGL